MCLCICEILEWFAVALERHGPFGLKACALVIWGRGSEPFLGDLRCPDMKTTCPDPVLVMGVVPGLLLLQRHVSLTKVD